VYIGIGIGVVLELELELEMARRDDLPNCLLTAFTIAISIQLEWSSPLAILLEYDVLFI
jgi:hypothetical protein